MYLLDTNICIAFAKGQSEPLRYRLRDALPSGLAMSAITFGELSVSARDSGDPTGDASRLEALAKIVAVRPFDHAAAAVYGQVAREVGIRCKSFDRLIGTHALSLGLTLVTNNERDFADIPGLTVENWTLPLP
jgi:tRNA(fMet)-specific endonuclease VapC